MTHSMKSVLKWAVLGMVILVLAGCDYNPSFRSLDSNLDGIRYGFKEEGEGTFAWKITFPSSVQVVSQDSYFRLMPEGGDDVLELDAATWLTHDDGNGNVLVEGTSGLLQAGVYYLRLMLAKESAYILVVQPIAIHRGQKTAFEQDYGKDDFQPFALLQVSVQATSDIPVKPEEATLEFFGGQEQSGELIEPLRQTNWKPDVRKINMKELGREYTSEGWTAMPQPNGSSPSKFWLKLTIRDAKGRNFIRTSKEYTYTVGTGQTTTIKWGTDSSEPINLLNSVVSTVATNINGGKPHGEFTFASVGTDGNVYRWEEYGGAEPGCEVRVMEKAWDNEHALQWVKVLSNPVLNDEERLTQSSSDGGYFWFKMPQEIKPFKDTNPISDVPGISNNIQLDTEFIQDKNAAIVIGFFMKVPEVAILNNPNQTGSPAIIHVSGYENLEDAFDATTTGPATQVITVTQNIDASDRSGNSKFIRQGAPSLTIKSGKHIALVPQKNFNAINITYLSNMSAGSYPLFTVEGGSLIIDESEGTTFTLDGGKNTNELIEVKSNGTLTIQGGTFTGSQSAAIKVSGGAFKMSGGTIKDNTHALFMDSNAAVELSGSAFIQYTGSLNNPANDLVIADNGSITITGELTGLSKEKPACFTPQTGAWTDGRAMLANDTENNYEKFKVTPDKDTNNIERPYILTSEGNLYGPQAYIKGAGNNRTYYQRLDKAFDAAPSTSPTTIYLLKDIELGRAGNEMLTVTGDSYITVPAGKDISLDLAEGAAQPFAIKRADITAKTFFTVKGKLTLGPAILDGGQISSSPPIVIVDGSSGVFTLSDSKSEIRNHSATALANAALSVKNGGTVELLSGTIQFNISAGYAGAIYNSGGVVNATGGKIIHNEAGNGGAIYNNSNGTINLSGTATLEGNKATGTYSSGGGAIYNNNGTVNIYGSAKLTANATAGYGGAIYNTSDGKINLSGAATLTNNTANISGKGIFQKGTFSISESARLSTSDDVFLPSGKTIALTAGFTGADKVATITPEEPITAGRQVLSGNNISTHKDRFTIKTPSDGTVWEINATGYLEQQIP